MQSELPVTLLYLCHLNTIFTLFLYISYSSLLNVTIFGVICASYKFASQQQECVKQLPLSNSAVPSHSCLNLLLYVFDTSILHTPGLGIYTVADRDDFEDLRRDSTQCSTGRDTVDEIRNKRISNEI